MNNGGGIFNNPILKVIAKILSWFVLSSLVLIAGFLIYYVVSAKISEIKGEKYQPAFSLYTIISPSMEPNINVYDVVVTKRVDPNSINEGDVITFISSSSLGEGLTITHRVKSKITTDEGVKFRTQGDHNTTADSALVTSNNILGKVIFKIPYLGHLQFLLQSKGGWIFILLIPAMFVVLYDVIKVIRLSNVKQKVEDSIKDIPENPEDRRKQERLKRELEEKYKDKNLENEEIPVMREEKVKVSINKENLDEQIDKSIAKKEQTEKIIPKPKGLEGIDMNKILNNISNLTGEQVDVSKVINNINNIEDDQNNDLPKLK